MRYPKTFARGTRTFLGFDDATVTRLLAQIEGRVRKRGRPADLAAVTLVPLARLARGLYAGGAFQGGVFLADLGLRRGPQRRHHVVPPESGPPPACSARIRRAWFGGYLFDHYGHFLLEGLARVLGPAVRQSGDPIVFLTPMRKPAVAGYMQQVLRTIGIDPSRIVLCTQTTLVESLEVNPAAFEIGALVRPPAYKRLVERPGPADAGGGVVYLSRSRLAARRTILNERDLEQALAARWGARIVHPETLPIADQIALFRSAGTVIACEGSALHTMLLAGEVARTIVLSPPTINLNYLLCDEACAGDAVYLGGLVPAGGRGARQPELDVDLGRVLPLLATLLA